MNKDFKFYYGAKGEYFEIDPTPDGSSDDDLKNRREYFCPKGKPVKVGDMTMTLLLKFTSANSATGYLDFRGSTEASKPLGSLPFVARAPVTLTR
jgi:hypothetical protein